MRNINTVVLCRKGKGGCCPVVTKLEDGGIKITDDYDGEVMLTEDESEMLLEHLKEEEKKNAIHEG